MTCQAPSESPYATVLLKLHYLNTNAPYVSHYCLVDLVLVYHFFFLDCEKDL